MRKLAGFDGHYQTSRLHNGKIGTAFNYHPGGSVDRRTNVYYAETNDFGQTWTTVDGHPLKTPLDSPQNPALVVDAEAHGRLVYNSQLLFDEQGRPVILYVTSGGYGPGPENDPRTMEITRWDGKLWITRPVTGTDHNYDRGSLYLDGDRWTLIAPALPGPQPNLTGGEVGIVGLERPRRPLESAAAGHSPEFPESQLYPPAAQSRRSVFCRLGRRRFQPALALATVLHRFHGQPPVHAALRHARRLRRTHATRSPDPAPTVIAPTVAQAASLCPTAKPLTTPIPPQEPKRTHDHQPLPQRTNVHALPGPAHRRRVRNGLRGRSNAKRRIHREP
jgi:hypothetical protein